MKVLVFNHAFFHLSETFIYKQVTGMPGDVDVELMSFEFSNEDKFPLACKKHLVKRVYNTIDKLCTSIRKKIFNIQYKLSPGAYTAVERVLKEGRYDVVHAHFGFNALLIYPLLQSLNIPLVVTFHGLDASPQLLDRPQYKMRLKDMLAYASGIIIVSPHMKQTLQLEQWNNKTHVIPCGVDPSEFKNTGVIKRTANIHILHSGRLVSKKGVPDLISVFASLTKIYPHICLNIIGDGPEMNSCRKKAEEAVPGTIQFFGAQSHEQVKRFMSETDIFVLNSRTGDKGDMEGVPVSLLEAMSTGLAVLSTRHAGIPYVIADGTDGLLVEEKENAALMSALENLIRDASLRERLGTAARQTVIAKFTSQYTNERIAGVYSKARALPSTFTTHPPS